MARRIFLLLLFPVVLGLLLLAGLEIWIASYQADDPKRAHDQYLLTKKRVADRQSRAGDPEHNGALAVQGKTLRPETLEQALAMPELIVVGSPEGMRSAQEELLAAAEALPPAARLRACLAAQELAARIMGQGNSTFLMVGVSMLRAANKPIFELMRSGQLGKSDYRLILERVGELELSPETMADRMDEDYLGFLETTPGANGFVQQVLLVTPGFIDRERRIYQNLYLRDRASIEKDLSLTGPPDELLQLGQRDRAFLVAISYPAYHRIRLQFARALTELSAMEAMAQLELTGKFPAQARDFLAEDGKLLYERQGKSYTLRSGYRGAEIEAETLKFR